MYRLVGFSLLLASLLICYISQCLRLNCFMQGGSTPPHWLFVRWIMVFFADRDLVGCRLIGNTILINEDVYIVASGTADGIWCKII